MAASSNHPKAKKHKQKKVIFQATFTLKTDPLLYEEIDNYFKSINLYE